MQDNGRDKSPMNKTRVFECVLIALEALHGSMCRYPSGEIPAEATAKSESNRCQVSDDVMHELFLS